MRRVTAPQFAIVAAVLLAASCGFKNAGTSTGSAGSGGRAAGGNAGGGSGGAGGVAGTTGGNGGGGRGGTPPIIIDLDGGITTDGPMSSPDRNCGLLTKTSSKLPPDILIVLDRSGSMNESYNGTSCGAGGMGGRAGGMTNCGSDSKWAKVVPAIAQVVTETEAEVNWGLKFFPESMGGMGMDACAVSNNAQVAIGPGNGAAIQTAITASTQANGGVVTGYNGTPTRNAANGATAYMQSLTDNNPKFILLATDGAPTCPEPGVTDASPGAIAAVGAAKTAGFSTFVVGIATANSAAADATLTGMATAGGLARAATPTYYPVTNADDLAAAIRTLVGVAATCTFQVGPTPTTDGSTALDKIDVFGDGVPILRDMTRTNGYEYKDATMQQIEVHGPLCDQIKSGAVKDVTVTFRCLIV